MDTTPVRRLDAGLPLPGGIRGGCEHVPDEMFVSPFNGAGNCRRVRRAVYRGHP